MPNLSDILPYLPLGVVLVFATIVGTIVLSFLLRLLRRILTMVLIVGVLCYGLIYVVTR